MHKDSNFIDKNYIVLCVSTVFRKILCSAMSELITVQHIVKACPKPVWKYLNCSSCFHTSQTSSFLLGGGKCYGC